MKNMISNHTRTSGSEMSPYRRSNEFNHLMNYFWNYFEPNFPAGEMANLNELEPHVQVLETKDMVKISAELPGIDEKNLDLQISAEGYLSICGEKKNTFEAAEKDAYFSEISFGTFKRTIPLPWDLDYDKANATYQNGVLTVSIPKTTGEKQKFRKLAINTEKNSSPSELKN